MSSIRLSFVVSLLALLPAATCGSNYHLPERAQRTAAQAIEVPRDCRRLEVQFHDGLLTLEDGPQLSCELQLHLVANDEAELTRLATAIAPSREVAGTTARLRLVVPNGCDLESVRTTWRLRAPAGTTVAVTTRRGGVVLRRAACDVEVDGGSGVVEANMAGGAAQLTTTSGSLMLRGDYPQANIQSERGRIDLQLPAIGRSGVDVHAVSKKGDVYVDLRKSQRFDFLYFGEERLVRCDPEVRVQWLHTEVVDGIDYLRGRIGALDGKDSGVLRLESLGPVYVRQQPDAAVTSSR